MAINPSPTLLDMNRIFQQAYNETEQRIRVDSIMNIEGGISEVVISHLDDSIKLGDGTKLVTATTVGSKTGLDVNVIATTPLNIVPAPAGATVVTYGINPAVAIGGTTFVCTYTIPSGNPVYLQRVYMSGEGIAKWTIYLNSTILMVARMTYTDFSRTVDFATGSAYGIATIPGDIIKIEVENVSGNVSAFDSTIQTMNT